MSRSADRRAARRIPADQTSAQPRRDRADRLAEELRGRIGSGALPPGDRLDEASLATEFGASRNAVREALDLLRAEGLIERRRGAGTRVLPAKFGHGLDRLAGLAEALADRGSVRNRVLAAEELAGHPEPGADRLGLGDGEPVVRLERLRLINGEPLSLDLSYLPVDVGRPLLDADLEGTDVFALIEAGGHRLGLAEVTVHASNASAAVAAALGIEPGDAIFTIERLTRLADGRPVDDEVLRVRADRLSLHATLRRGAAPR
ncbi:GntR family transcriptional regulator [Microlunatus sp. GCM10028923]|uniref:GntR family transcriptional regulator n=1 Tax=Microlunatus sp. GCM10028923 TaxID=3273400 RepID=UPI00360E9049